MTQLVSNLSTTVAELKHEVIVIDGTVGNSVIKVDFISNNFNPRRLSFIENFFRTPECGSLKLRKYINYQCFGKHGFHTLGLTYNTVIKQFY